MYGSGIELPKVSFASIDFSQIPAGSYFIGFDLDTAGALSKMDSTGAITVIGGGVIDVGSGANSTYRIDNNNTASGDYSTVSGGYINTASGYASTISGGYGNIAGGAGDLNFVGGGYINTASG
jgi:hypothetical protein